jgi:uncharacterized protein YndB with AHSA1/START domain
VIEIYKWRLVPATPEELWPLIDDVEQLARWFTFAERIELVEGSGVGRRQRLHGKWGRKSSEIDQRVTIYKPNQELVWEHEAERLNGKPAPVFAKSTRFSIKLTPEAHGTRVELRSQQEPASRLKGVVIQMFGKREVAQHMDKSLDQLAAIPSSSSAS